MMDQKMLQRMAAYCSRSEHCQSEVREKLRGVEGAEGIMERLINEGFIDNARYARAYVRDKFRFNRWGRVKIRMMLMTKKIENEIIDEALAEIDEEEYVEVLRELIEGEKRRVKAASDYELRGKLFRFAAGRGFEGSVISKIL